MNEERINKLFPAMLAKAEKKERVLEVLFHPGTVLQDELQEEFSNTGANEFHISEGRQIEYRTVMSLHIEDFVRELTNGKKDFFISPSLLHLE